MSPKVGQTWVAESKKNRYLNSNKYTFFSANWFVFDANKIPNSQEIEHDDSYKRCFKRSESIQEMKDTELVLSLGTGTGKIDKASGGGKLLSHALQTNLAILTETPHPKNCKLLMFELACSCVGRCA